jgi:hypothetical protein
MSDLRQKPEDHADGRAPAPRQGYLLATVKVGGDALPEEEAAVFGAANVIANPIADAWEKADEEERSSFVRSYKADILERVGPK